MFKIEAKKCFKIRKALVHAYQKQGEDLDVIFKCEEGEQRCSRLALQFMSDFFTEQLEGRDRMGNELTFNYDYPKHIIKHFLDMMHSIDVELNIVDLMLLIKFLKFEAKSDESDFESTLLEMLTDELKKAENLNVATKLLINHVCNSFDGFRGYFEKTFFEKHTGDELIDILNKMDWTTKANKELKSLITNEDDESVDCEIEGQMYVMIKMMKKKQKCTAVPSHEQKVGNGEPRFVEVSFGSTNPFKLDVNTSHTTQQLMDQVSHEYIDRYNLRKAQVLAKYPGAACIFHAVRPVHTLKYKGDVMEGSLEKYNMQEGDTIDYYWT